jgi:hypothetical protein
MSILFVGPARDRAEAVLRDVGERALQMLPARKRASTRVLWGAAADRSAVDRALVTGGHILYFGHGLEDRLGDPALLDDHNIAGAAGHVVLAMACSSARRLGRDGVGRCGLRAYLGFTRPVFVPLAGSRWSRTPWFIGPASLLAGASTGSTEQSVRRAFCEEGDRILVQQRPTYEDAVNDMLVHYGMALAFQCLGSRDVSM